MTDSLDRLNSKTFGEQLHTQFKVHLDNSEPVVLELSEVEEHNASPKTELFILRFRGPLAPRLNQQIHHFEHDKLGKFDLFMTAVAGDQESTTYEIVFNRFRK